MGNSKMSRSRKSFEFQPQSDLSGATITQEGDILQLGSHRIICGDSTSGEVVEKLLDNEKPVLMVTEPPYEKNYSGIWKQRLDPSNFFENPFLHASFKLFPGNVCYIWHSSLEGSKVEKALRDLGFECHFQIIWAKNEVDLTESDFHWHHEPCWYAVRKRCSHHWQGSETETTLWSYGSVHNTSNAYSEDMRTIHPAQKPLECMARPIRNNSDFGDAVYDPFSGSGSTLIACEKLDRRCYAVEIAPKYCDAIVKRWIDYRRKLGADCTVTKNGAVAEEYFSSY